jgi:hypothetical protein
MLSPPATPVAAKLPPCLRVYTLSSSKGSAYNASSGPVACKGEGQEGGKHHSILNGRAADGGAGGVQVSRGVGMGGWGGGDADQCTIGMMHTAVAHGAGMAKGSERNRCSGCAAAPKNGMYHVILCG